MKRILFSLAVWGASLCARAATSIDVTNPFAYGANVGWVSWSGDTNNGAVIGEYVCSGTIYAANAGWINLGSGVPTNGIYYQNTSATDFGVNQLGNGDLRGYAYGANVGWIAFETNGRPHVDLYSGQMSGAVWCANCGWISLSNAVAQVKTAFIAHGLDANGDGIADAWELQHFGTTNVNVNADPDHDGATTLQEYLAGTDPNNGSDALRITHAGRGDIVAGTTSLGWNGNATCCYAIEFRGTLNPTNAWQTLLSYGAGTTNAIFNSGLNGGSEFYRVRAFRPLVR